MLAFSGLFLINKFPTFIESVTDEGYTLASNVYSKLWYVHEYNKQNVSELLKCLSLLKQISKWFKC